MPGTDTTTNHLRIPIEGNDAATAARRMRKHLTTLQRMALGSVGDGDDMDSAELEALRAVTGLLITLQKAEEDALASQSPP